MPRRALRVFRWVLLVNIDHNSEIRRDGVTGPNNSGVEDHAGTSCAQVRSTHFGSAQTPAIAMARI